MSNEAIAGLVIVIAAIVSLDHCSQKDLNEMRRSQQANPTQNK